MINNILKKIEKANEVQKVELAKHEVELALMGDIDKLNADLSKLFTNVNEFYRFKAQAINYASNQSKEISDVLSKADNLVNIAIKQAKDLGIDLGSNDTIAKYKKAKDGLNYSLKVYQNFIDKNR